MIVIHIKNSELIWTKITFYFWNEDKFHFCFCFSICQFSVYVSTRLKTTTKLVTFEERRWTSVCFCISGTCWKDGKRSNTEWRNPSKKWEKTQQFKCRHGAWGEKWPFSPWGKNKQKTYTTARGKSLLESSRFFDIFIVVSSPSDAMLLSTNIENRGIPLFFPTGSHP